MKTVLIVTLAAFSSQTVPPKNLAGAEFPCSYEKGTPNTGSVKFHETVGDVTFFTGDVQIRSANVLIRADSARCEADGDCKLSGAVTVTLAPSEQK